MQQKLDHSSISFRCIVSALQVIIRTEKNQLRKNDSIRVLQKIKLPQSSLDYLNQLYWINFDKLFQITEMIKLFRNAFQKITQNVPQYHAFRIEDGKVIDILLQIQKNINPSNFRKSYLKALQNKAKDFGWSKIFLKDWIKSFDEQKNDRQQINKQKTGNDTTSVKKIEQVANQQTISNVQNDKPLPSSHINISPPLQNENLSSEQQNNSNILMQEQKITQENYKQQTQEIIRSKQEYEKISAQTLFYKRIRQDPDLKPNDVVLSNEHSSYFQSIFFKKLHQHKIEKLGKLIKKINTPRIKKRKLPFTLYLKEKIASNNLTTVGFQNVSKQFKQSQKETNFSEDALKLGNFFVNQVHDNQEVDIDEFFKYDWSRFEVMSFNNCGLRTADLVKMSRNALEMLPNLKHLYLSNFIVILDDNKINLVRSNDLIKFVSMKKIELNGNQLDLICENEIEKFLKARQGVLIERY